MKKLKQTAVQFQKYAFEINLRVNLRASMSSLTTASIFLLFLSNTEDGVSRTLEHHNRQPDPVIRRY